MARTLGGADAVAETLRQVEEQQIVYLPAREPSDETRSEIDTSVPAPNDATWRLSFTTDPVGLFRFSALTANAHRIHYDRRYVTEVEGYAGLIVHGPLQATLLHDLLRWQLPDARVATFEFRALRPLFDLHPFSVCGAPLEDGKTFRLWTRDHEGAVTMDATARIE